MGGEEFAESGPNFLNYVQTILPGRGKHFFQGRLSPCAPPSYGPYNWLRFLLFLWVSVALNFFSVPPALPTFRRPW